MKKEECCVCKFWISKYDDLEIEQNGNIDRYSEETINNLKDSGMCRRYPPVAVTHDDDVGFYSFNGDATDFFEFVHTEPYDWCGEFVEKRDLQSS